MALGPQRTGPYQYRSYTFPPGLPWLIIKLNHIAFLMYSSCSASKARPRPGDIAGLTPFLEDPDSDGREEG